jgi:hypothetical protein
MRGEPADHLGQSRRAEQLLAEHPVADVAGVIELARGVVELVDPDVVQQAARPDQARVGGEAGGCEQLPGDSGHDLAVRVHQVERRRGRRVPLVQLPDLLVGRNPHGT